MKENLLETEVKIENKLKKRGIYIFIAAVHLTVTLSVMIHLCVYYLQVRCFKKDD